MQWPPNRGRFKGSLLAARLAARVARVGAAIGLAAILAAVPFRAALHASRAAGVAAAGGLVAGRRIGDERGRPEGEQREERKSRFHGDDSFRRIKHSSDGPTRAGRDGWSSASSGERRRGSRKDRGSGRRGRRLRQHQAWRRRRLGRSDLRKFGKDRGRRVGGRRGGVGNRRGAAGAEEADHRRALGGWRALRVVGAAAMLGGALGLRRRVAIRLVRENRPSDRARTAIGAAPDPKQQWRERGDQGRHRNNSSLAFRASHGWARLAGPKTILLRSGERPKPKTKAAARIAPGGGLMFGSDSRPELTRGSR